MKVNGTGLVAIAGVGLLAAGMWLARGLPAALMTVGAILLLTALVDVLLDVRGKA